MACLTAIPRLQAREALLATTVAQVAGGHIKKSSAERTLRSWRREAGYNARPVRPKTLEELRARAMASGIGFREVPRK